MADASLCYVNLRTSAVTESVPESAFAFTSVVLVLVISFCKLDIRLLKQPHLFLGQLKHSHTFQQMQMSLYQ